MTTFSTWIIEDILSNTKDLYRSKHDAYVALNWYRKNYPDLKLVLRKAKDEEIKGAHSDLQTYVLCLVRKRQLV